MAEVEKIQRSRIHDLTDNMEMTEVFKVDTGDDHWGLTTGYGYISGKLCYFYSQNPECTQEDIDGNYVEQVADIYRRAIESKAPIINIFDGELKGDSEVFNELHSIILEATSVVPVYSVIYGKCYSGNYKLATIGDFKFMRANGGEFHIAPVIDSDIILENGEEVAEMGAIDYTGNKSMLNPTIKGVVSMLHSNVEESTTVKPFLKEIKNSEKVCEDTSTFFMNLADNYKFIEVKKTHAPEMVTGFIQVNGQAIGVYGPSMKRMMAGGVAEFEYKLTARGLGKLKAFVLLCEKFNMPVLSNCDLEHIAEESDELVKRFSGEVIDTVDNLKCPQGELLFWDDVAVVKF